MGRFFIMAVAAAAAAGGELPVIPGTLAIRAVPQAQLPLTLCL
jgi:hypothetical protein